MDPRKAVVAALAGGSMLAGVALGAAFTAGTGSSANAATTTPTSANTRADASASPGVFVSNEDPAHEATESAEREAQENAGQRPTGPQPQEVCAGPIPPPDPRLCHPLAPA